MTLEVLFARAAQGQAFLLLAAGGAVLGGMLHLAGWLHRVWRLLGMTADVLCALAAALLLLGAAFVTGSGLRAYALLGLLVGLALYRAGVQPVLCRAVRLMRNWMAHAAARRAEKQA